MSEDLKNSYLTKLIVLADLTACGGQASLGGVCVMRGPSRDLPAVSTMVGGLLENSAAHQAHAPLEERERVCFCAWFTRWSVRTEDEATFPTYGWRLRTWWESASTPAAVTVTMTMTVRGGKPPLACPRQPQVVSVQARLLLRSRALGVGAFAVFSSGRGVESSVDRTVGLLNAGMYQLNAVLYHRRWSSL